MAPALFLSKRVFVGKPVHEGLAVEAWSQGYILVGEFSRRSVYYLLIGSLIIMAAITIANMRRGIILHKLILLELILGTFHGTFILTEPPVYSWYLSVTAIFLNISWSLHNVIAWMKTKPFLSKKWSWFYIGTVILVQPYWVVEIYANFAFFNKIDQHVFETTRPYEALFRDPWWVFTTVNLFYNITTRYSMNLPTIIFVSPRFGVLLVAMLLSIAFIILDICSVTGAFDSSLPDGLNPFWKLAFVFKCLTDSIILDDFKTALDRLTRHKMQREGIVTSDSTPGVGAMAFEADSNDRWSPAPAARKKEDPLSDAAMDRLGRHEASNANSELQGAAQKYSTVSHHEVGQSTSAALKPMAAHVDHYDEIDLPDLEGRLNARND